MSYQPGGGYGQQPGASGQPYGQYPGYGQQAGGQQGAGQQAYGQPAYGGGQPPYGQPQPPGRYGYGAQPSAPARTGQGLPANVRLILAAVVGGLGLLAMFCGFLTGAGSDAASTPVFGAGSQFAAPYIAIVVAAFLALTSFLPGDKKPPVAAIAALTVAGTVVTLFAMIAKGDLAGDTGAGAIILLVAGILMSIAAVLWLLVDSGLVKTAGDAPASPPPGAGATPGTSAAPEVPSAPAQAPADSPAYGGYGSYGATQYGQPYGQGTAGQQSVPGAGKPPTDPGAAQSAGPSYGSYGSTPPSDGATAVFNNPGQPGGGQPGAGQQSNFSSGPGYGI